MGEERHGGGQDTPPWSRLVFNSLLGQSVVGFNVTVRKSAVILRWGNTVTPRMFFAEIRENVTSCALFARVVHAVTSGVVNVGSKKTKCVMTLCTVGFMSENAFVLEVFVRALWDFPVCIVAVLIMGGG